MLTGRELVARSNVLSFLSLRQRRGRGKRLHSRAVLRVHYRASGGATVELNPGHPRIQSSSQPTRPSHARNTSPLGVKRSTIGSELRSSLYE